MSGVFRLAGTQPEPKAYPPETVLNIDQVAEWLQVSVRTVERLDIPFIFLGIRQKRYLGKDVLKFLEQRKSA